MSNKQFAEYVVYDLLHSIPALSYRAMFGGFGIYKNGIMTAAIMDNALHLKGKYELANWFMEQGSTPFVFEKKDGTKTKMDYWKVPDDVLEDTEKLKAWFFKSYEQSSQNPSK